MKTIIINILYILLVYCSSVFGQTNITEKDTIVNKTCLERGHISNGVIMKTLMYCESYIIDTDNTTIRIFPACNYESYICSRCRKYISELEREQRVVIWRKNEILQEQTK